MSLAAVVPDLVAGLWQAASSANWTQARALHERLYPLAAAIYRDPPGGRATARLKAALKILGRIKSDAVRPPQPAPTPDEYLSVEKALGQIG